MTFRPWLALLTILAVLGTAGVLYASGDAASRYDTDDDGVLSYAEMQRAARDYFAGNLSRDQAVDLTIRQAYRIPIPQPTATPTPTPPTPLLNVRGAGAGGIEAKWTNTGANVYLIAYKLSQRSRWTILNIPGSRTTHRITGLPTGTYSVSVKASYGSHQSEWSAFAAVAVIAAPTPVPTQIPLAWAPCSGHPLSMRLGETASDIRAALMVDDNRWPVSLFIRVSDGVRRGSQPAEQTAKRAIVLKVESSGEWVLELRTGVEVYGTYYGADRVSESGTLERVLRAGSVPVHEDTNEIVFVAKDSRYTFSVNRSVVRVDAEIAGLGRGFGSNTGRVNWCRIQ